MSADDETRRIGVIGAGNPLMGDDGVGVAVLDFLKAERIPKNVRLVDVGSSSLSLLHEMSKLDAAIIIDAVDFGSSPGATRRFTPEDAESVKTSRGLSTHETDLLRTIELSGSLGERPAKVVIFAIQPESVAPSMELSPALNSKMSKYVKDVIRLMREI